MITTQSAFDTAVGLFYPLGAGLARQVSFAPGDFPKYGAVGAFGAQGPGVIKVRMKMRPAHAPYAFEPGRVYNLDSSEFICLGRGASGAHSDIAKPEVAHAIGEAVRQS
jgi:hypothetical protein